MLRRTFLLAFIAPTLARAHSFRHGNIAIGHAWALPRQLADGQVFFPMAIKGKERDELVAELSLEEVELAEVEAALTRIQEGKYGVCEATGAPIDPERLRAIPWTRFTQAAAAQLEAKRTRPTL